MRGQEPQLAQEQKAEFLSRQGRLFRVAVKLLRPVVAFIIDEALIKAQVEHGQQAEREAGQSDDKGAVANRLEVQR